MLGHGVAMIKKASGSWVNSTMGYIYILSIEMEMSHIEYPGRRSNNVLLSHRYYVYTGGGNQLRHLFLTDYSKIIIINININPGWLNFHQIFGKSKTRNI